MSAPCVTDTCSITSQINPVTRRLQLDARLNPTGGLRCGTDSDANAGLGINLDSACGQLLSITGSGKLRASGSVHTKLAVQSSRIAIPHTDTGETEIQKFTSTNPFNCEAQALIFGRYELRFDAGGFDGRSETDPYRAHLVWRTLVDGNSFAQQGAAAVHQHIGGGGHQADNSTDDWVYFFGMFAWAAGAAKTFTVDVKHFDLQERTNLSTAAAGLGGTSYIGLMVFPMSNTVLA